MISCKETNTVYISSLLKKKAPKFYISFKKILMKYGIPLLELPYTNDIWCRDYMPLQINENTYVNYRYDPDYLKPKKECGSRTNSIEVWNWLVKNHYSNLKIKPSMLVLDGGNVVKSQNKIILTEKIFSENFNVQVSQKSRITQAQKTFLIKMIKKDLEVNEVIIIPRLNGDWLGHADGMVRFLNENEVLVSDFDFLLEDKNASRQLKKQVEEFYHILEKEHNLKIHKVPYYENYDKKCEEHETADGCYINYLQTKGLIVLPQFNNPMQDRIALKRFKELFESVRIKVEPIDATEVSCYQGVINCVTWNIKTNLNV